MGHDVNYVFHSKRSVITDPMLPIACETIDEGAPVPFQQSLGRFKLIEILGKGGFGTVWKGIDEQLNRFVAIKVPHGHAGPNEYDRFRREASAAAQLRHPNIVTVYEIGVDSSRDYIVSEFVNGVALSKWISRRNITPYCAAKIVMQIASAIQHAHEAGIVHRDLKPSNIIMDKQGAPHLTDFGLAKYIGQHDDPITVTGVIIGTPGYLSPEQASGNGKDACAQSDIFSLGAIFYELLTGQQPFDGDRSSRLYGIIHREPTRPSELNSAVPAELEEICLRCLRKHPRDRYYSAQEIVDALQDYLDSRQGTGKGIFISRRVQCIFWWSAVTIALMVCLTLRLVMSSSWTSHQPRHGTQDHVSECLGSHHAKLTQDATDMLGSSRCVGRDSGGREGVESPTQVIVVLMDKGSTLGMKPLQRGRTAMCSDGFITALESSRGNTTLTIASAGDTPGN